MTLYLRLFATILVFNFSTFLWGQPPIWERPSGSSFHDVFSSVVHTSDGGYIAAGWTWSAAPVNAVNGDIPKNNGLKDGWIMKVNASGSLAWSKTYGGSGSDSFNSILEVVGGYIVIGQTNSAQNGPDGDVTYNHGDDDYWVVKVDTFGNLLWEKTYGGAGEDTGASIVLDSSGYILGGSSYSNNTGDVSTSHGSSDYWIIKVNSTGAIIWSKLYGGQGEDKLADIKTLRTSPGMFVAVGSTWSALNGPDGDVPSNHGAADAWVMRFTGNGALQWSETYGGLDWEWIEEVSVTEDRTLVVAGRTESNNTGDIPVSYASGGPLTSSYDAWVFKIDQGSGLLLWSRTFGGTARDFALSLKTKADGNHIVAGSTYLPQNGPDGDVSNNNGFQDAWIFELDTNGNLLCEKNYGGAGGFGFGSIAEHAKSIEIVSSPPGGYIFAGVTDSNNSGDVSASHGWMDGWLVRIPDICQPVSAQEEVVLENSLQVYPNPSNGNFNVKIPQDETISSLVIFDITGKTIYKRDIQYGEKNIKFN